MKNALKTIVPRFLITAAKRVFYKRRFARNGLRTDFAELVDPSIKTESSVRFLGQVSVGSNVSIGKYTYLTDGRISSNVTIGRYCSVARGANIAGTEHPIDWLTSSPVAYDTEYFPETGRMKNLSSRTAEPPSLAMMYGSVRLSLSSAVSPSATGPLSEPAL